MTNNDVVVDLNQCTTGLNMIQTCNVNIQTGKFNDNVKLLRTWEWMKLWHKAIGLIRSVSTHPFISMFFVTPCLHTYFLLRLRMLCRLCLSMLSASDALSSVPFYAYVCRNIFATKWLWLLFRLLLSTLWLWLLLLFLSCILSHIACFVNADVLIIISIVIAFNNYAKRMFLF